MFALFDLKLQNSRGRVILVSASESIFSPHHCVFKLLRNRRIGRDFVLTPTFIISLKFKLAEMMLTH